MANRIKGITIEIGGDTTKLQTALKGVNSNIKVLAVYSNKELLFLGWTVIRFWGKDVIKKTDYCIKVIEETIFSQEAEFEDYIE